jgi:DNA-binding transcriptional LysR family regulator
VRIGDLRDQPIITYPRDAGIGLYWPFLQLCAKAGFQPNVVKEAQESSLIVGLVAAGVGIAVVPATTRCIALPGVAYRRIKGRDAHSTLYLARRKNDPSLHAKELLRALRLRRISSASGD